MEACHEKNHIRIYGTINSAPGRQQLTISINSEYEILLSIQDRNPTPRAKPLLLIYHFIKISADSFEFSLTVLQVNNNGSDGTLTLPSVSIPNTTI